ncbi:hypothetical protein CTEN210_12785 [Chaetoceros tenuissimus]|uniref:Uncharacterized protein n=1 Tax=Chaetoceros tenuissimus TaxID=426638 RepID=A0AAD3D5B6_9STRA|nr:hypothetical protein CTEN210_12785 [Chaetoceros tenuissimus]
MVGFAARDKNPHFPGTHKYIALSQQAQGDLVAATDTMNRAVLYEAPWDDTNTIEIREMFQELQAKKKSKAKKSIKEDCNKDKYVLCKSKLDSHALSHGYEVVDTSSSTAPMASYCRGATRLNFWLTTGTVGSYLCHPKRGKTQLFRRDVTMTEAESIFEQAIAI